MKRIYLASIFLIALLSGCRTPVSDQEHETADFQWQQAAPEATGMSEEKLKHLADTLFQKNTKKLLIIKNDKVIVERYAENADDPAHLHYTASLAKAIVAGLSLSVAMHDSLVHADAPAFHYIPEWSDSYEKSKISIRHLATHTSGIEDAEVSREEEARMASKGLDRHMDIPGWKGQFWRRTPDPFSLARDSTEVLFTPGSNYEYSNPGIAMLTYAVTASLKRTQWTNIRDYLKERIFDPIGIPGDEYNLGYDTTYRVDGLQLVPSWGGGAFSAGAIARIGRLMLRNGNWQGKQLLHANVVKECVRYAGTALPVRTLPPVQGLEGVQARRKHDPVPATTLGWYSNYDGNWEFVPRDAFCGAGAGNQILLVIPSLDLIVVRMGGNLFDESKGETFWSGLEQYLFNPLMDAHVAPPYAKSDLVTGVSFAPAAEVIRLAEGGDNWPMTWAANDTLYTAYGDGQGFAPMTKEKLSLGLAKVSGFPPDVIGENIRTPSGERVGEGQHGPKASGMLMVEGNLYMLTRNMKNARLATSPDHGRTWLWADWSFEESFGCPNFINYGKNYSDAPDNYVYIYSADDGSAYHHADHMVMARVPKDRIMDWRSYEFFAGYERNGAPVWAEDIRKRQPVFSNPAKCYRNSISYNKGLERYLWCQVIPLARKGVSQGPRFSGGLGIFESENPWGPWRTVYYTRQWDMGPGESGSLPTKWMSEDGKTLHYVFSGDDAFSVRRMTLETGTR